MLTVTFPVNTVQINTLVLSTTLFFVDMFIAVLSPIAISGNDANLILMLHSLSVRKKKQVIPPIF